MGIYLAVRQHPPLGEPSWGHSGSEELSCPTSGCGFDFPPWEVNLKAGVRVLEGLPGGLEGTPIATRSVHPLAYFF